MERSDTYSLAAAQSRLSRLIREPSGVAAALAAEGSSPGGELGALLHEGHGVSALERLSVYANAYFARLRDCLADDFGALARALGAEAFGDLVTTYLMMFPPSRPSLRHAGAQLAEHLTTEPFAEIFSRACPYAADLARLEWALCESFCEADRPALERHVLTALPAEAWSELRLSLHPSLRLLRCAWPVSSVRRQFDREPDGAIWAAAPALSPQPELLRVFRVGEQVRYKEISSVELAALHAVLEGCSFAELCEELLPRVSESQAASEAARLVAAWLADGLLVA